MRRIDRVPPRLLGGSMVALLAAVLLASCGTATRWEQPAPPPTSRAAGNDPGQPPRSRSGNPPFYEVFGTRYHVMRSSAGYRERGVASWYGPDFHGKRTSSGERYDMHALTAAHKTLPLPTRVRVTNLRNGRSVIVMINDRGPFVPNRIIDLSYAAAQRLDMVGAGTTLVEVEALPWDADQQPPAVRSAMATSGDGSSADTPSGPSPAAGRAVATTGQVPTVAPPVEQLYLQLGAFGERANALALQQRLEAAGLARVEVHHAADAAEPLYRVRVGPITDVSDYAALAERLKTLQIHEMHLVTAMPATAPGMDAAADCTITSC